MLCWITEGKEIENRLPFSAINSAYSSKLNANCTQYELFPEYIDDVCKHFTNKKVEFARKVAPYISDDDASNILDVKEMIIALTRKIKKWNSRDTS